VFVLAPEALVVAAVVPAADADGAAVAPFVDVAPPPAGTTPPAGLAGYVGYDAALLAVDGVVLAVPVVAPGVAGVPVLGAAPFALFAVLVPVAVLEPPIPAPGVVVPVLAVPFVVDCPAVVAPRLDMLAPGVGVPAGCVVCAAATAADVVTRHSISALVVAAAFNCVFFISLPSLPSSRRAAPRDAARSASG
jgi:hypothetical protein